MMVKGSWGLTAALRASSSAMLAPRPRSRRPCSEMWLSGSVPGSMTMIVSRSGSRSRTSSIFATCSAFSHRIARACESPATHSHSSGELVG